MLLFYTYGCLIQNNKNSIYFGPHSTWPPKCTFLTIMLVQNGFQTSSTLKQTEINNQNKKCSLASIIFFPEEKLYKSSLCPLWTWENIELVGYSLSCVQLLAIPWIVTHQVLLSMGFPRQEYWSGLPFSSSGDPPDPGIEPVSPALADRFFTTKPPGKQNPKLLINGPQKVWNMIQLVI